MNKLYLLTYLYYDVMLAENTAHCHNIRALSLSECTLNFNIAVVQYLKKFTKNEIIYL